ncbi:MAG: alpha/beta fold hydrolase [Magnetospiraceae bacterium]
MTLSTPYSPLPWRDGWYNSFDGLKLYYRDYVPTEAANGKPALLCLAGLSRNSRDFQRFADIFGQQYRLICPDYRGRGLSEWDPKWQNYQPQTYLEDIRHLLTILDLHHVVVIGISLGGILGMALGAAAPSSLAGVFLNDVGPQVNAGGIDRIIDLIGTDNPRTDWPDALAAIRQAMPELDKVPDAALTDLLEGTYRRREDGMLHVDWDTAIVQPIIKAKGVYPDLWPLYRTLTCIPLAGVRGGLSDVLTPETFAEMAQQIPVADFRTIPGAGHVPPMTHPIVLEAVHGLLGRI